MSGAGVVETSSSLLRPGLIDIMDLCGSSDGMQMPRVSMIGGDNDPKPRHQGNRMC